MSAPRTQHLKVTAAGKAAGTDDYNRQLMQAETQLQKLNEQREAIERARIEAEEVSHRKQDFLEGQIEILARLDHSVQAIDREIFESRQELKELEEARKTFASHLQTMQAVDPQKWKKTKLSEEVDHAMEVLERCEGDFDEISANISEGRRRGFLSAPVASSSEGFVHTLKQGFAFNLPVIVLGTIALLVFAGRI